MLKHVQQVEINMLSDVLGVANTDQQRIVQPDFVLHAQPLEHTRFDAEAPCTVLPKRAHFVCLVIDQQGNTFVSSDKIYIAKLNYSLRNIIPHDSIVHALLFPVQNSTRPVLGLFDASCVAGQCLRRHSCIARHAILHQAFRRNERCAHIRMHWVGHERVLVHDLQYNRVAADFEIDCALRLSDSLAPTMQFHRLIPQEPIVHAVPRLNNTKMNETLQRKRAKLQHEP
jgi:hypothetical protein